MAVIIAKTKGHTENEAEANQDIDSQYSDVEAGEWYTGWINLVEDYMTGYEDRTFRPNEEITQADAIAAIVRILGWGDIVDQTGEYPSNYITKASELGLFNGAVVEDNEYVMRGNAAIYIHNALDAERWDITETPDGELGSTDDPQTLREMYFFDYIE